jgi:hypothetical protein
MLLWHPRSATFTFEVDSFAAVGDTYRDRLGHVWRVESVREARAIVLREPEAPSRLWEVTFQADHPAYRVERGERLMPLVTRRSGEGWAGQVQHDESIGFGEATRIVLPTNQSIRRSWIYREVPEGEHGVPVWQVQVGPHVQSRSYFSNVEWGTESNNLTPPIWERIEQALTRYLEP